MDNPKIISHCPVGIEPIPDDCNEITKDHTKVLVHGRVYKIRKFNLPPYEHYFTVVMYPAKGSRGIKDLKFKTEEEFAQWNLEENKVYTLEGCSHRANGNEELIFSISNVIPS